MTSFHLKTPLGECKDKSQAKIYIKHIFLYRGKYKDIPKIITYNFKWKDTPVINEKIEFFNHNNSP